MAIFRTNIRHTPVKRPEPSNFDLSLYEHYTDGDCIVLTKYLSCLQHVILPSPEQYPSLRVSNTFTVVNDIDVFDFNNIPIIPDLSGFLTSHDLSGGHIREVRNLNTPGTSASSACYEMESLPMYPDHIENLEEAYCYNKSKETPVLPSKAKNLRGAFNRSHLLKAPEIPSGVTTLESAFLGSKVHIPMKIIPGTAKDCSKIFFEAHFLKEMPNIGYGVENLESAFFDTDICEVKSIPESVTNLDGAFGRTNITKPPKLPKGLTQLNETFIECYELASSPALPAGLISMHGAFKSCHSLKRCRQMPKHVLDCSEAYRDCVRLEKALPPGPLASKCQNMYFGCLSLTEGCDMPDSVILASGFYGNCVNLTHPGKLGKYVEDLEGAYSGCIRLIEAPEIPEHVKIIAGMFRGCKELSGDIIIRSRHIINISMAFPARTQRFKTVYIPFYNADGTYTDTYKSFEQNHFFDSAYEHLYNMEVKALEYYKND